MTLFPTHCILVPSRHATNHRALSLLILHPTDLFQPSLIWKWTTKTYQKKPAEKFFLACLLLTYALGRNSRVHVGQLYKSAPKQWSYVPWASHSIAFTNRYANQEWYWGLQYLVTPKKKTTLQSETNDDIAWIPKMLIFTFNHANVFATSQKH